MEGTLFTGLAFAFTGLVRRAQAGNLIGSGTPLTTTRITSPDNGICTWFGFSPVNDQTAFVSGTVEKNSLYITRPGQPDSFEVLWESTLDPCMIKTCAWSPNGQEIAFIVQATNSGASPKTTKISIYVVDVATKAVREPVVISEAAGGVKNQLVNVSNQKGLAWRGNSFICVPANDGGVMKFDSHTGQSEQLIAAPTPMIISHLASTAAGELRYVKSRLLEPGFGSEFMVGGLDSGGVSHDYGNLTQLGPNQLFSARLSQDGKFVFVEKRDTTAVGFSPATNLIYRLETQSVIGEIPAVVFHQRDTYAYIPLNMQDNGELILIEMATLAADDGSMRAPVMRPAKLTIS